MATQKISEMTEAIILQDEDYAPIIQSDLNKKIKIELLRDYNKLHNKPILNGVTIENNKNLADYNITKANQGIKINNNTKQTLELETLTATEMEQRADVNKAVTVATADKMAKETAHQQMSKDYLPNAQDKLAEGENQPVSYKAVKEYVDSLETKVDENETDIENKYSTLNTKINENESDIENKVSVINKNINTIETNIDNLNNKDNEIINIINYGGKISNGNEYRGETSDYGLEIEKAEGAYKQKTTNGYQLFDASKLPTKSQGGATVTNNGDGSFTVSGSGNLSEIYTTDFNIQLTADIRKMFKVGKITLKVEKDTSPRVFFQFYNVNTILLNIDLKGKTERTLDITQEIINNSTRVRIGFAGNSGSPIKTGTIKPMLYQDGDGTWEPFTGGMPSPNPEYPQEIKSFDVKEIKSSGKNLFDYITFCNQSNWTVDEYGNITHEKNDVLGNKFLETYLIQGDYIFTTENKCQIQVQKKDGSSIRRVTGTSMKFTILDSGIYNLKIFAINNDTIPYVIGKVMLNKGSEALPFEPFIGGDTTPLNLTLRSLPNGAKDTYENGVITRRVGVVEFDGSDDENWELQSINNYGISNFRFVYVTLVNNSVISNRFVSQKEFIADTKTEGIFNNANQIFIRISKDKASTVEEFKTYLKTHKTIAFIEKTPTTEQVTLPIIPSYYPFTNAFHDSEVESNITWKANTCCRSKYTDDFFKQFFALQRTGKVYTVRFPLFEKSTSPAGEKLDSNKGLVCTPSTDTIIGESDYDDIPLFKTYDVNAYVNDGGNVTVTAMKGDKEFRDTGEVDVFVLGMSYYEKYWTDDSYWYYSRTDLPKEGYTLAQECVNVNGSPSSYALYSKYVSGEINGKLYSSKGLVPKRNMSYNNCETMYHKRGQYYSGGNLSLYKYVMTTFWLKYATLNSQSVIYGCLNYVFQYLCTKAENNVKRIIIAKAQAVNVVIGSCVSIGDKGTNSSLDRGNAYMHNKCDSAVVTKIESIDETNSAIYVDAPNTFNTTLTTYITSMHWKSGTSDKVLGRDGSIGNLTNGKYPMVIQGIELAVGGYEVTGNAFMDIVSSTGKREVYITNNPKDITTNVTNAKANYKKSPLTTQPTNLNAGNYVTHMDLDVNNGAMLITKAGGSGSGTATGFCDQLYVDVAASGQREFLLLGSLGYGLVGGLSCLLASAVLSTADWPILARLSLNGVKG